MNQAIYYLSDPWLDPYRSIIDARINKCIEKERQLSGSVTLKEFAMGHFYYGLHMTDDGWVFRDWAPNAEEIFLTGTFNEWKETPAGQLTRINKYGDWEIRLPHEDLKHGDLYKLSVHWKGGKGERIPSYATRLYQDETTKIF